LALPLALLAGVGGAFALWRPAARLLVLVFLVLSATAGALESLLAAEFAHPERLALAPEGARYRRRVVFRVGGAATACGMVLAAPLLVGRWRSAVAVATAIVALPPTYLFSRRGVRVAAQIALFAVACAGALAWARPS
jgi:hypothetical protein